jgi:hypothetical protein
MRVNINIQDLHDFAEEYVTGVGRIQYFGI